MPDTPQVLDNPDSEDICQRGDKFRYGDVIGATLVVPAVFLMIFMFINEETRLYTYIEADEHLRVLLWGLLSFAHQAASMAFLDGAFYKGNYCHHIKGGLIVALLGGGLLAVKAALSISTYLVTSSRLDYLSFLRDYGFDIMWLLSFFIRIALVFALAIFFRNLWDDRELFIRRQ